MESREGIGDRLRTAAFAELQARDAFGWAADHFSSAPASLRSAWRSLSEAEDRHLGWLLERLRQLGAQPSGRPVSDSLWRSLTAAPGPREFALFMAAAEERGRLAGEKFAAALAALDPVSSRIFGRIAEEEAAHVALAKRYFEEAA